MLQALSESADIAEQLLQVVQLAWPGLSSAPVTPVWPYESSPVLLIHAFSHLKVTHRVWTSKSLAGVDKVTFLSLETESMAS